MGEGWSVFCLLFGRAFVFVLAMYSVFYPTGVGKWMRELGKYD